MDHDEQERDARAAEIRHYVERLALVLTQMGLPAMPARVWVAAVLADGDTVTARRKLLAQLVLKDGRVWYERAAG